MTPVVGQGTVGFRLRAIAERLPGKVAIVEGRHSIDYRQLWAQGAAIAHGIAAAGNDRAAPVCLLFESKLVAITAIVGASQCGRPYIPLDAGDPDERLRFILAESEPTALLTEGKLMERARALAPSGCTVIDVERVEPDSAAPAPADAVSAGATLYRFYTSGSTGQPKGVSQVHRNLLHFVDAYVRNLGIREDDRVSLLYSLSFSGSNMDIFGALLNGATVCAYDVRRDGISHLADWLDRERVTILHTVPTVFRELMNSLPAERRLVHLKGIDLGGESVFDSDVALFLRHTLPQCILVNHLAITEASVVAQNVVRHDSVLAAGSIIAVGKCPEGVSVRIQREDGSEAPRGEVGEIVVSSPHVSPGYWNRPELNAAVFSDDPEVPGSRRYFTGDLGHIDGDGNLHFLGRKGTRIKLRGYSIDLMEVESAICAYPGVSKAAVLAVKSGQPTEPDKLVAYIAAGRDAQRDPVLVRRFMAKRLPPYMLPTGFVFLDELPVTSSGKVDRKTLAQIAPASGNLQRTVTPPQDDTELAVAGIFAKLLKLEAVGRDDDFFLLGGDSMSGVELQIQLRESFAVHIANFHEDASVAGIAAAIRRGATTPGRETNPIPVLVPLWRTGDEPPLFLVHGRHGQAFVSPQFMQLLGNNQPVWAFQAAGLDGLREPHSTVEEMAAEYVDEMRKYRPHGPYFLGSLCAGSYVVTEMARSLRAAGETVLPLLLLDPPNRLVTRAYANMDDETFAKAMTARRQRGTTAGPVEDPAYMTALRNTALAFENAIARHTPRPYDGPAYALTSRQRLQAGTTGFAQMFRGGIELLVVGTTHNAALDPRNTAFATALQSCVKRIREAARVPEM
jgi:amino acid adenylation domain-containing protein